MPHLAENPPVTKKVRTDSSCFSSFVSSLYNTLRALRQSKFSARCAECPDIPEAFSYPPNTRRYIRSSAAQRDKWLQSICTKMRLTGGGRIRITCRNEAELQLVKEAAEKSAVAGGHASMRYTSARYVLYQGGETTIKGGCDDYPQT